MNLSCQSLWKEHTVERPDGGGRMELPAQLQMLTESWNRVVATPYVVYMPEKARLLMLVNCDYGPGLKPCHYATVLKSDDWGTTWTEPRYVHTDSQGNHDVGMCFALTYLDNGRACLTESDGTHRWFSDDYGDTWDLRSNPPASNGQPWREWDPMLIDRDPETKRVVRLMSYCADNIEPDGRSQGYIRFSSDQGRTWYGEIKVPEMVAVNEVAFIRAGNGDIVAACRTDNPERFKDEIDHYGGLAVSISKDDGCTWSKFSVLYEWGRHHPSMVLLANGDVVMTYVVRKGYPDTEEGYPQFGVEAVVSHDNGETWDLEGAYILTSWKGNSRGDSPGWPRWWASSQATSTLLIPDGAILTAFGTGYRSRPNADGLAAPRDVGLLRWRAG